MTNSISYLLAGFVGAVGVFASVMSDTPVVEYKDQQRSECVRVISKDPNHSCTNLPEKYSKVWVN
jgi:hypothetical protein